MASFLLNRKDHHDLWMKCLSEFKRDELIFVDAYRKNKKEFNKRRFYFQFPDFFKIYSIWKRLNSLGLKYMIKGFMNCVYLSLVTYYMFKKIDFWLEVYEKYKPMAYVSYSSYRNNDETIMTQICRKNNKKTFTLQNYAVLDFEEFNYESITYENIISDYFLLWGEAGKEILKKYIDKNKLLVVGNPDYLAIKKIKKRKFQPKIGAVSLDYPQYDESNFEMIKAIKDFTKRNPEIKFYLSLHPDLDKKKYVEKIKGKNINLWEDGKGKHGWMEQVKKSDFLVVHNTTIALESLKFQIPIFRYKDKASAGMTIPEKYFSNSKELEELIFGLKGNENYGSEYYDFYLKNFHQPKGFSIPEYYKKIILKIANNH